MTTYYLMVKTHNITGLNYLCQTMRNPYKYKGSGIRWKRHLKVHGYNITTKVLITCYTKSALREWGMYYSKLWSVVISNKWANLKDETGEGGGGFSEETLTKMKESQNLPEVKRKKSISITKSLAKPDVKKRQSDSAKLVQGEVQNRAEIRENKSKKSKENWANEEYRTKWITTRTATLSNPEYRAKMSKVASICQNRPEVKQRTSATISNLWSTPEYRTMMEDSHCKIIWEITMPTGEKIIVKNLSKYCRENKLEKSSMLRVASGKQKQHKGYNVIKLAEE